MIPEWANAYVGLPFGEKESGEGYDCWQLARMVLSEQFKIELPDYRSAYTNSVDTQAIQTAFTGAVTKWVEQEQQWQEVQPPELCGDLAFFHLFGSLHCGVILDQQFVLHILRGAHACLSRYKSTLWRNRLIGIYRHNSRSTS